MPFTSKHSPDFLGHRGESRQDPSAESLPGDFGIVQRKAPTVIVRRKRSFDQPIAAPDEVSASAGDASRSPKVYRLPTPIRTETQTQTVRADARSPTTAAEASSMVSAAGGGASLGLSRRRRRLPDYVRPSECIRIAPPASNPPPRASFEAQPVASNRPSRSRAAFPERRAEVDSTSAAIERARSFVFMTDRYAAKWEQVWRRLDELQHQLDRLEPFKLRLMPV